jgi:septal ring factor EnvC (AmiA/AmiB activator)
MSDLLAEAAAELYEADPDEFTQRRAELAAHARDSDQPAVAKQIAALRKPTRAAWVANRLARTHPEAAVRLDGLAAELRTGTRVRELTQARHALIDELTSQAFAAAHLSDPPFALREDVRATIDAAVSDPEVAASLAAGTLVRAAHWAGFGAGFDTGPLEPAPAVSPASRVAPRPARAEAPAKPVAPSPAKITEAERAVADASRRADAAAVAEEQLEETVSSLEAELEQARERLALARREAYQAQSRLRRVTAELGRLRK